MTDEIIEALDKEILERIDSLRNNQRGGQNDTSEVNNLVNLIRSRNEAEKIANEASENERKKFMENEENEFNQRLRMQQLALDEAKVKLDGVARGVDLGSKIGLGVLIMACELNGTLRTGLAKAFERLIIR